MKLPLRHVDVMNSYDANVRVADEEESSILEVQQNVSEGYKFIVDAEGEVVALVSPRTYKGWSNAETICELLNWASSNYPYRHGDE